MKEKEKMLAGMIYDANYDEELLNERARCKDLCHEYNQVTPSNRTRQREIIKKLFGSTKAMRQKLHLVIMFSLLQTADFIPPGIHLTQSGGIEVWNMPILLPLAAMFGLAVVHR